MRGRYRRPRYSAADRRQSPGVRERERRGRVTGARGREEDEARRERTRRRDGLRDGGQPSVRGGTAECHRISSVSAIGRGTKRGVRQNLLPTVRTGGGGGGLQGTVDTEDES